MSNKIYILQVFGEMNRGGAESMIMELFRNMDRTKIQFDFMVHTTKKCAYDDEIIQLGGQIFNVPAYRGFNHFEYLKSWNNFFNNNNRHKIIHSHIRSTASMFLKIAKKYNRITIAHSHNTSSGKGITAFYKNTLQQNIPKYADNLFACSEKAGRWLFGDDIYKKGKCQILKNGIDLKQFEFNPERRNDLRKELGITDNAIVIGHVGRFHYQKNHEFLIEIFKAVQTKNKSTILLLVGNGKLRKCLEKKVKDYGLTENVFFMGVRNDVNDLLQAMDIFVFPSHFEGLPVTLIEAQASGIPIIASDNISKEVKITDLVEFVSLKKSAKEWSEKVLLKAKNYQRKSPTEAVKIAGYDVTENTKWLENFYINIPK